MGLKVTCGDTVPLSGTYATDGIAVNLTGYEVSLTIAYQTSLVKVAVLADQNTHTGQFQFEWGPKDLLPGYFEAQIKVKNPSGKVEHTDIFSIEIGEKL